MCLYLKKMKILANGNIKKIRIEPPPRYASTVNPSKYWTIEHLFPSDQKEVANIEVTVIVNSYKCKLLTATDKV